MTAQGHDVTLIALDPNNPIQRITVQVMGLSHNDALDYALKLAGVDKYKHLYTITALKPDISSS